MTKGEAELNKMRDQLYDDDDQSCPSTEMDEFHEMLMDEDIHDDTLLSENPNEGLAWLILNSKYDWQFECAYQLDLRHVLPAEQDGWGAAVARQREDINHRDNR